MTKIDGLEIVMTKYIKSEIDKELKKRFEELKPDIAKRYEELLNMRNMETDQFNDGFNDARAGKPEIDHPHYDLDTDNWRLGYAWGMFEPMKEKLEAQETIVEIQKMALEDAKVFHRFDAARYVSEGVAVRTKKGNWIPYKPSWAAPACNSRQIVKLNNGWVCCATYFYNKDHAEKDPCWQWKNDSGEWIDPGAVIYWKGLEE